MKNKIVYLKGGLGNQLFQFTFFIFLKKKFPKHKIILDKSYLDFSSSHVSFELQNVLNKKIFLKVPISSSIFNYSFVKILSYFPFRLPFFLFNEYPSVRFLFHNKLNYSNFIGYWQNPQYLNFVRNSLLKSISFNDISASNYKFVRKLEKYVSIAIHIRLGDYKKYNQWNVINLDYYKKAIDFFENKYSNTKYVIFTNDQYSAKKIIDSIPRSISFTIVNWNNESNSYQDLYLMSKCHHIIIANSTFSWWAAILNKNKDKHVVAPKLWNKKFNRNNLILDNWITF
jgi:hypothetical protein